MNQHVRERAIFVQSTPAFLRRLEDMIEELIAMRDQLDGDADLEDGHDAEADPADDEQSLGWTDTEARGRYAPRCDSKTGAVYEPDAEQDDSDREVGLNELWDTQSQDIAAHARGTDLPDDDEDGHDAEHDTADAEAQLGWAESESLTGELKAGTCFGEDEDGDSDTDIADQPHDWDELEAPGDASAYDA